MIEKLNKAFSKLPGVGSKTAQRFIYHLLERDRLGGLLRDLSIISLKEIAKEG